jgi:hypothetical protein
VTVKVRVKFDDLNFATVVGLSGDVGLDDLRIRELGGLEIQVGQECRVRVGGVLPDVRLQGARHLTLGLELAGCMLERWQMV